MKKLFVTFIAALFLIGSGCNRNPVISIPAQQIPVETKDELSPTTTVNQVAPTVRTFSEVINRNVPKYTFRLTNVSAIAPAHIDIFRGANTTTIFQVITLDPAVFMRMSDDLPFATDDVNFDGYIDIGVLVDGGAKWGAFQYWTYDRVTGTFVTTTYTQELKDVAHNGIKFDKQSKRIITSNFYGTGPRRDIYQYFNGHIKLIEDDIGDNIAQDPIKQNSPISCKITIVKYSGDRSSTTTRMLPYECPLNYFGF